jgi:DNA adenine methylase
MKTPLTYYGGKQQLSAAILALIPAHKIYAEPFIGGAAIYFAKEPSPCEVINDTNGELVNFYEVMKRDFTALQQEIAISLHSRKLHHNAEVVYSNPDMFDRVKRAWAVWMLANTSYGAMMDGGFGYDRKGKFPGKLANKREAFTIEYAERMQNTQIECCDALRIIGSRDTPETFFYCDPPYVGADQGHYDGYTQDDFDRLLDTLAGIQGKFLLSSYRNKSLTGFIDRLGWDSAEIRMNLSMSCRNGTSKQKIEVLTANYPIMDKIKP